MAGRFMASLVNILKLTHAYEVNRTWIYLFHGIFFFSDLISVSVKLNNLLKIFENSFRLAASAADED